MPPALLSAYSAFSAGNGRATRGAQKRRARAPVFFVRTRFCLAVLFPAEICYLRLTDAARGARGVFGYVFSRSRPFLRPFCRYSVGALPLRVSRCAPSKMPLVAFSLSCLIFSAVCNTAFFHSNGKTSPAFPWGLLYFMSKYPFATALFSAAAFPGSSFPYCISSRTISFSSLSFVIVRPFS